MQVHSQNHGMIHNHMPGQQPQVTITVQQSQPPQEWNNSLLGCCSGCGSCCLTICCPCVQYGRIYEKVHNDGCCCQGFLCCLLSPLCLSWCIHKGLRSDVRKRYNIQKGCSDCCVTFLCAPCATCQEARELKDRG